MIQRLRCKKFGSVRACNSKLQKAVTTLKAKNVFNVINAVTDCKNELDIKISKKVVAAICCTSTRLAALLEREGVYTEYTWS